jgi:hypothetical protein
MKTISRIKVRRVGIDVSHWKISVLQPIVGGLAENGGHLWIIHSGVVGEAVHFLLRQEFFNQRPTR